MGGTLLEASGLLLNMLKGGFAGEVWVVKVGAGATEPNMLSVDDCAAGVGAVNPLNGEVFDVGAPFVDDAVLGKPLLDVAGAGYPVLAAG